MNRTEALCRLFGWQGGTIHQVAEETGCDIYGLLYGEPGDTPEFWAGYADFPEREKYRGCLDFWLGAAYAIIHNHNFVHDRAMSLHRRAYECPTFQDWCELAAKVDCPTEAVHQIWSTVQQAREAGLSMRQAFPLIGDTPHATP